MPDDLQQASGRKQEDDPEEEVPLNAAASPGCVLLVWLLYWLQPLCSPFLEYIAAPSPSCIGHKYQTDSMRTTWPTLLQQRLLHVVQPPCMHPCL